jgi:hypothetical protein
VEEAAVVSLRSVVLRDGSLTALVDRRGLARLA